MGQPSKIKYTIKKKKISAKKVTDKRLYQVVKEKKQRKHKEYGTSKLEEKFAKEFLDKLGINYSYQFKAESIGRYFDFYCPDCNLLIEIDGDFFHSYGKVYEEMSPMQKHNATVDKIKNEWALTNGIPIIRIWEHDINDNPDKVMKMLKETVGKYTEKYNKELDKKKRH